LANSQLYRDRNLQIIFCITLISILAVSTVTPALSKIVTELEVSPTRVGLVISSFTLPGILLAPFLGILADRFGRKRILVPSIFLFAIAGTSCAFARDFDVLLALRVLQGMGGASLGSLNSTLIGDIYSGRERSEAMGLSSSVLNIGTGVYPFIGGAIALLGWNYPFALSILAIPVGILVLTMLQNPEPTKPQDLREYLVGTWKYLKNVRLIGWFVIGVISFIIAFGAYLTYFSLYLGRSFRVSTLVIGLIMSSRSITAAAVSLQFSKISTRFSLGSIVKLAFLLYATAMLLIPLMPNIGLLLVPTIIIGAAEGLNFPCIRTAIAGLAPLEYRGAIMSLNGTVIRMGQTLGPVIMAVVYDYGGFHTVFYFASLIVSLVLVAAFLLDRFRNA
jgi:MFS family permease